MRQRFWCGYRVLAGCGAFVLAVASIGAAAVELQSDRQFIPPTAYKSLKITPADRQKIQHIIELQIKAFQRNDETIAFSYAAPETRKYFGNPRAFMEMVKDGYSALYRSDSRQFLDAAVIDGTVIQPLRLVTPDGETVVALYTMQKQPDKEWRISGCELAPSTLLYI